MIQKPYVKEITLTIITFMWFLFVATNVNVTLGQTYLHFTLGSLALLIIGVAVFDKKIHITFQKRPGGQINAIIIGALGWILLLILSVIALRFIDPSKANIASIIGLLGATTPALATSNIANWITFGGAVAFIETQLWARLLEFFRDLFEIDMSKNALKKIFSVLGVLIILLSIAFMLFHLTAKGVTNTSALIIVFIMMMISLGMITIYQETRQAVYFHIWANAVASYFILFVTTVSSIL